MAIDKSDFDYQMKLLDKTKSREYALSELHGWARSNELTKTLCLRLSRRLVKLITKEYSDRISHTDAKELVLAANTLGEIYANRLEDTHMALETLSRLIKHNLYPECMFSDLKDGGEYIQSIANAMAKLGSLAVCKLMELVCFESSKQSDEQIAHAALRAVGGIIENCVSLEECNIIEESLSSFGTNKREEQPYNIALERHLVTLNSRLDMQRAAVLEFFKQKTMGHNSWCIERADHLQAIGMIRRRQSNAPKREKPRMVS